MVWPHAWRMTAGGNIGGSEIWRNTVAIARTDRAAMPTPTVVNTVTAAQKWSAFFDAYNEFLTEDWSFTNLRIQRVGPFVTEPSLDVVVVPVVGSITTSPPMPPDCAICLSLETTRPGPSGRGRIFLCGFSILAVSTTATAGRIDTNTRAAIRDAAQSSLDGEWSVTPSDNWELVVASFAGSVASTVTGGYIDDLWDTRRSRDNNLVRNKTLWTATGP